MKKASKDLPYNTTHNIRVEGELVKKKKVSKPSLIDIYTLLLEVKKQVDKNTKDIKGLKKTK